MNSISNSETWNKNEQQGALCLLKLICDDEEKLKPLIITIAPTVIVLVQLLNDRSLNSAARATALSALYNIVSSIDVIPNAYIIALNADVLNAAASIMQSEQDICMRAMAALIVVVLLLATEENEAEEDQTVEATSEHAKEQARITSERIKAMSADATDLASQCAKALVSRLSSVLASPGAPSSLKEPSVREVMTAINRLACSHPTEVISHDALPRLVEAVERLGENDEVYTPAIEAIYCLLEEEEDDRIVAFLAEKTTVGRLRSRIAALLEAHEKHWIALSLEAQSFSNYVIQLLDDSLPEPAVGGPQAREPKHIMVSYAHAQKGRAVEVAAALEQRGLLVWRDEVGTAWCGKMRGDADSKMAEAIDKSYCVLCIVSREYCASTTCKKEVLVRQIRCMHACWRKHRELVHGAHMARAESFI